MRSSENPTLVLDAVSVTPWEPSKMMVPFYLHRTDNVFVGASKTAL